MSGSHVDGHGDHEEHEHEYEDDYDNEHYHEHDQEHDDDDDDDDNNDHGHEHDHTHPPTDWLDWLEAHANDDDEEEADEDEDEGVFGGHGIEVEVVIEEVMDQNEQGESSQGAAGGGGQGAGQGRQTRVIRLGRGGPYMTQREVLALLRGQYINPTIVDDGDGRGERFSWNIGSFDGPKPFPKVPSEEGRKLMQSGVFGTYDRRQLKPKALARRLLDRELGLDGWSGQKVNRGLMAQSMLPSTKPEMVIHYDDPVCCGQFSDDGNFFYACDFKVRLYDTSSPYNWRHYKTVRYPFGQWTMTDADLSPDNKWLAFSSLQPHVGIAATDPNDTGEPYSLDLSDGSRRTGGEYIFGGFAIFSVRFSGDGRHLVAGTGQSSIVVYDIERRKTVHHVVGHRDDVNAVCFADKGSPHILYSGSDDCTVKVWDTRSLGDGREAGAFVGHIEGLTYIDTKGDGRYVLSNGKDQSMKLWDLRMAMSTSRFEELDPTAVTRRRDYEYDYRWQDYEDYQWFPHPHDNSLVTFRGHKVQRTLIRCHFSPPNSTDSHYVYSGSYDGFVYVWNLDATLAAKIDVRSATRGAVARPPRSDRRHRLHLHHRNAAGWEALVRDVGWHPNAPMLVASAWSGPAMDAGTASLHSFNEGESDEAEPPMGIPLTEKLGPLPEWSSSR
ncbi:e4e4a8ae-6b6b-444e-8ffa-13c3b82724e4 [Thermothielavioides terrestris]|uniref:E4e4a8ae-6b6b-444e-8ffa-13c3b82724e4 n=1 Tax=Thermothielavioides terrestris TaxID=2587410 RepID=A0A446BAV1_9PEZI|nr:e4e4a8ae-6b6b-444e-8ffa-13c3b82724e4 [Thermothielavioides terrestris]